jgi:hypothetical protein
VKVKSRGQKVKEEKNPEMTIWGADNIKPRVKSEGSEKFRENPKRSVGEDWGKLGKKKKKRIKSGKIRGNSKCKNENEKIEKMKNQKKKKTKRPTGRSSFPESPSPTYSSTPLLHALYLRFLVAT